MYKVRYVVPRSLSLMIYARNLTWNENVNPDADILSPLAILYISRKNEVSSH